MLARVAAFLFVASFVLGAGTAHAQTQTLQTQRQATQTRIERTQAQAGERLVSDLDARDRLVADIWGLSHDEMARAKALMQGPRASFSVQNLSPVEALGIHARNDAERSKYADLFAKAFYADVQRSLAWNSAFQESINKLTVNDPIVSFEGLQKVQAPIGSADAMNVPRSLVVEPGMSGPSSRARNAPPLLTQPAAQQGR